MNNPPAFQFYAQDFLTGVMYLTNEEVGMYVRMLCKQWTDGNIPKKRLGLLVGCEWDKFSDELKSKFKDEGEYLINLRLEKEREKKARFIEKQRENGRLGGRPTKKPKPFNRVNPNESQKKPLEDEDRNIDKGVVGEKGFNKNEYLMNQIINNQNEHAKWIEEVYMRYRLGNKKLGVLLKDFNGAMVLMDEVKPTMKEYKRHFFNWMNIQESKGNLAHLKK